MTLIQLEYFNEIVNLSSFTKAANKLYVSQPTLSKSIQALEKELGVILIDRNAKEFKLTDDGDIFYKYSTNIITKFNNETRELMARLGKREHKLSIGLTPTSGAIYFFDAIYKFRQMYPVIDLQIVEVTSDKGLEMLESEELDLCVSIEQDEINNCVKLPVVSSEAVLVVSKDHELANRHSVSFADVAHEKFIMIGKTFSFHTHVMSKFAQAGITPNIAFESNQWEFVFEMVANNQGVSILPKPLMDKFNNYRVQQIYLTNPSFEWILSVVRKKSRPISTAMNCFWTLCENDTH